MFRRTLFAAGLVACTALALAGCAGASSKAAAPVSTTPAPTVTVDNCGTTVSVATPPKRVVTIKSTSLDMMLALGLGDRVVGSAFADGPTPSQWAAQASRIPVLSAQVPSEEVVLSHTPDFVYAGWESNFSADGAGTRAALAQLGVSTYVSPSACGEPGYKPDPLTWNDVFGEMSQVAHIFHVSAAGLIAQQKKELKAIPRSDKGLTALWYSSASKIPYVGGGSGAPELIMKTLGLRNIAADVDNSWTSFGWEKVVAADPDVIVLVDSSWGSTAKKIGVLEANPATAALRAVREHHYLIVPFDGESAGVRTIPAAKDLAAQLAKLSVSPGR